MFKKLDFGTTLMAALVIIWSIGFIIDVAPNRVIKSPSPFIVQYNDRTVDRFKGTLRDTGDDYKIELQAYATLPDSNGNVQTVDAKTILVTKQNVRKIIWDTEQ